MVQRHETGASIGDRTRSERLARLKPVSFPEYYRRITMQLQSQQERYVDPKFNPYQIASEVILNAILEKPPIVTRHPYTKQAITTYPSLTRRGDRYDVIGADESLKLFVEILGSEAATTTPPYHLMMIAGPSGAGKDYLIRTVTKVLEDHTSKNPLYKIDDCPIQEHPLNILTLDGFEEDRELFRSLGVNIEMPLCPHCRNKYEDEYGGDEARFMVKPLTFNGDSGRGIGVIDPNFDEQSQYDPSYQKLLFNLIGRSNRGLLVLPEFFKLSEETIHLYDLWRDRILRYDGQIYRLDMLTIALTTTEELERYIKNGSNTKSIEPLVNRIVGIELPYITQVSEEARLYRKALVELRNSPPHISPFVLETAARIAVATRLDDPPKDLTMIQKIQAYDGKRIAGVPNDKVIELLANKDASTEGLKGLPPTVMIEYVRTFFEKYRNIGKCPNVITFLDDFLGYILERPEVLVANKGKIRKAITESYEEAKIQVTELILSAFRPDFANACATTFEQYLLQIQLLYPEATGVKMTDRDGSLISADETFMRKVELAVDPPVTDKDKIGFRGEILSTAHAIDSNPGLNKAIKSIILGDSPGGKTLILLNNLDAARVHRVRSGDFSFLDRGEQQIVSSALASLRTSGFGCCDSCGIELMLYAAKSLSNSSQAKKIGY